MAVKTLESLLVRQFETSGGARIFQIPLSLFPGLWGFAYLVLVEDGSTSWKVLIDAGSGFGESNQHLAEGFKAVSGILGRSIGRRSIGFADLTHILITHGHIDHFGGLAFLRKLTSAKIGIHELDLRNLTNYEERLIVVARRLEGYLVEAGIADEQRQSLIELYKITKGIYHSGPVDFTFEAIGMRLGPFEMLHTPGHCAGHTVIQLHDVLFSGDHILADISPHQSPEILTQFTGLGHYLQSLERLRGWAKDIRLTLGGHKEPVEDLGGRIDAIREVHTQRLKNVLVLLSESHTIWEIAQLLFGETYGYNVLLAIEEAGAHVEYLYQRGLLGIDNLKELESGFTPVPVRYRCLPSGMEGPLVNLGLS